MKTHAWLGTLIVAFSVTSPAIAHHSYAMFDGSKHLTVHGTLAKFEWRNPHVFLWLYVPEEGRDDHALYVFESDSINNLRLRSWTRDSLRPGEKVTVEFFALKDGRRGGHLIEAIESDGTVLSVEPGPVNGIEAAARRPAP